MKIIVIR